MLLVRPKRNTKKLDYHRLHSVGHTEESEVMDLTENTDDSSGDVHEAMKSDAAVASADEVFSGEDPFKELTEEEVASHIASLEQEEAQMAATIQREKQVNKLLELTLKTKTMKDKLKFVHEQGDNIRSIASGWSRTALTSDSAKTAPLTTHTKKTVGAFSSVNNSSLSRTGVTKSLLKQIRSDPSVQHQVNSVLQNLEIEEESDSEEDVSARPVIAQSVHLKSGRLVKLHDTVRTVVIWHQQRLGVRYMPGKKLDFDNLHLRLLITGEIEKITSEEITEYEKNCRLNLVKEILYDAGLYEWQAVK